MKGSIGLASWLVIVLIGSLWILPELSQASPVPAEEPSETTTSRPMFSGLRNGIQRVKEMVVNGYEYSVVALQQGAAVIKSSLSEEKTEGPPTSATKNDDQFVFPDPDASEVAFAEERQEFNDHHTASPSTQTTTTTTTTTSQKDDITKSPAPSSSASGVDHPDEVVVDVETTTDGVSLDDRSLFDVPEKSKCGDKQRVAKDGSCRTAVKQ